jgi:hypothetical protein
VDKPLITQLREQRDDVIAKQKAILDTGIKFNRNLSSGEQSRYDELDETRESLTAAIRKIEDQEAEDRAIVSAFEKLGVGTRSSDNPLRYTREALDALQGALDSRTAGRFVAGEVEQRAALATGTLGGARAWGSNVLAGPRLLHVAAGVPQQGVDAIYAQHPKFTLPTASASVGENTSLAEFDDSTAGSVTLGRYGRWTDLSRESLIGADAGAISAMHQIGIAKDLDKALIDAVETAAGSAVAFSADVPGAIRKAMAGVIDATAAEDAADLVVLVHPDNVALLQDVSPIGGITTGEGFQKFSGALVYASSAVNTGFMTVANLKAGCRYFSARGLTSETDLDPKTDTLTVATSVIGGYGIGLTGGFAAMVDVVTP